MTDTLFAQGAIPANEYSLCTSHAFLVLYCSLLLQPDEVWSLTLPAPSALQPITDDNGGSNVVGAGTLTFGGVNEEEFIGPLK